MLKTTKKHIAYWKNRKIDWKTSYFDTWDHPHRRLIIDRLKRINWGSILEVGCASGPNLHLISKEFPGLQLGGVDVSADAIQFARENLPKFTFLDVTGADKIFLSNKSVDVILTDMCLIYVSPLKIKKVIKELKRIGRTNFIFVEFHSSSIIKRAALALGGYYAHDFKKLLEDEDFYDITLTKLKESDWPGGDPQKSFGYIITARI